MQHLIRFTYSNVKSKKAMVTKQISVISQNIANDETLHSGAYLGGPNRPLPPPFGSPG